MIGPSTIDHPDLEPFAPLLERLLRKAEIPWKIRTATPSNWSDMKKALREFHYACDDLQREVGRNVIEIEQKLRKSELELKEARRSRNPQAKSLVTRIRVLEKRQLILRRIVDGLLYKLLQPEEGILKHFELTDTVARIDPVVLSRTLRTAFSRNRENRLRISIVGDLSTIVQIGDLVEIEWNEATQSKRWMVIELKEGPVNDILQEIIGSRSTLTAEDLSKTQDKYGKHAPKQAIRITRQRKRKSQVEELLTSDKGFSPKFEIETLRTRETYTLSDYQDNLKFLIAQTKKERQGMQCVDKCLRLIASRGLPYGLGLPFPRN